MDELVIKEIAYSSSDYESEIALRDRILRKPLGLSLYDENLEHEKNDIHIGAFYNGNLAGVLILTRITSQEYKMRQVAVDDALQGKGIGKRMVVYSEELAKNKGAGKIVLHARKTAVPFYAGLGYQIKGDEFIEVNIPHKEMFKHL